MVSEPPENKFWHKVHLFLNCTGSTRRKLPDDVCAILKTVSKFLEHAFTNVVDEETILYLSGCETFHLHDRLGRIDTPGSSCCWFDQPVTVVPSVVPATRHVHGAQVTSGDSGPCGSILRTTLWLRNRHIWC